MALYIKAEDVAALAARVARELHVDKTEAVRRALVLQVEALAKRETLPEKIARLQARVKADGFCCIARRICGRGSTYIFWQKGKVRASRRRTR